MPMYFVRTTRTASMATAVQIVRYENRKQIIVRHVGSAHNQEQLLSLKQTALEWIAKESDQLFLFHSGNQKQALISLNKCEYLGVRYSYIYEVLFQILGLFGFQKLKNQLLLDLVIMRVIQPVSKLESLEYLSEMFGITYKKGSLYQALKSFPALKSSIEKNTVAFAKDHFHFDFSIVFYDVTTLYFESFKEDGFRKYGYSKDNKANQPQIVIGLIVTHEGFPVAYEVFEGNTFEGKTFIPTICKFKDAYKIKNLTVVADAAMISLANVESLVANNLSYIVGARVGNLKLEQIQKVSKELGGVDGKSTRIQTERGALVCDFSFKRYQKDKREMERHIHKAEYLINEPSKVKRSKFLRGTGQSSYVLNTELIEKTRLLLGIRGYYTSLNDQTDQTIISQYHNLWHVEQAFRIAKSDLAMRPIYHFKRQAIEAHILICFMALAVCKYMELRTGKSSKRIVKLLKSITEARIKNKLTGELILMRKELTGEIEQLWKTLLPQY